MTDENLLKERRNYNRFDIRTQSVALTLIIDDYKKIPGIGVVDNISLGGICVLSKENIENGKEVKFQIAKSKTIFYGRIAWVTKNEDLESFPFKYGMSFIFPHKDEATLQKKELVQFVLKTLGKLPKEKLVDRLIELFIERRRIFDATQEKLEMMQTEFEGAKTKTKTIQDLAHNIIDLNLASIIYFGENYEILYSNEAAEKAIGYGASELKELSLKSIVSESTEKMLKRYFNEGNNNIYNGTMIDKDGSEHTIKWRIIPYNYQKQTVKSFIFLVK